MKLLALAASNSSRSINRQLVDYALRLLADGEIEGVPGGAIEVDSLDVNEFELPLYSLDRQDAGGIPQLAHDFFDRFGAADAILISFAEHNGSYSVGFKNIYDWASRIDQNVYQNKPVVMLSTSIGGGGAGFVLQSAKALAGYMGSEILAAFSVPRFGENFDTDAGVLSDSELDAELRAALATLATLL